ncbi:unnamed protein product [Mytilus coruscus]|uniref:Uncharacterized protein n=1 Tax=Mytilus coruscus TaxID=42192 RepID=A0A6J8EBR4_MYTCO|nr:unnamed protein product [Mytilus coruscus]
MSSIATDDLFNEDRTVDETINEVVKSVEERTCLRQRRSMAMKVKLQEINDRKNKLDELRLNRLASVGIHVDIKSIRDEVKKTIDNQRKAHTYLQLPLDTTSDTSLQTEFNTEQKLDVEVKKNLEDQKRLNMALERLQQLNPIQYDKDRKQVKNKRRKSVSNINVANRPSSQTTKFSTGRRKSISNPSGEFSKNGQKSSQRRNSIGNISDRTKSKGNKSLLAPIESKEFKKVSTRVKNAVKVK